MNLSMGRKLLFKLIDLILSICQAFLQRHHLLIQGRHLNRQLGLMLLQLCVSCL